MISQIKNFYDFFIMFPNVISVSSESKISLITLVTIFLFVTFDRGRTYSFLLTFFTSYKTKPNLIQDKNNLRIPIQIFKLYEFNFMDFTSCNRDYNTYFIK